MKINVVIAQTMIKQIFETRNFLDNNQNTDRRGLESFYVKKRYNLTGTWNKHINIFIFAQWVHYYHQDPNN